jgi:hypothetical protein
VSTGAVPVVMFAIIEMPWALVAPIAPAVVSPAAPAATGPLRLESNAPGKGVSDGGEVFSGRDTPLEEPAPTF